MEASAVAVTGVLCNWEQEKEWDHHFRGKGKHFPRLWATSHGRDPGMQDFTGSMGGGQREQERECLEAQERCKTTAPVPSSHASELPATLCHSATHKAKQPSQIKKEENRVFLQLQRKATSSRAPIPSLPVCRWAAGALGWHSPPPVHHL